MFQVTIILLVATTIFAKPLNELDSSTVSSLDQVISSTPAPVNILSNQGGDVVTATEVNQAAGRGAVTILGTEVSLTSTRHNMAYLIASYKS